VAISAAVFERIGVRVSSEEVERLIVAALEQMLPASAPADPRHELSPEEASALERGGLSLSLVDLGPADPLVRAAADYAALLASSLTVPQAARRLDVDGSRIRQRLAARTLYGIKLPAGWRLPAFQFAGDRPVPGIDRVLPHLPPRAHPLAVASWFRLPNPDLSLDADETPLAPLDWLKSGGDPQRVAALADALAGGA
jgi:hypothetical protein